MRVLSGCQALLHEVHVQMPVEGLLMRPDIGKALQVIRLKVRGSAGPHRVLSKCAAVKGDVAALVCQDGATSRALVADKLCCAEGCHRPDANHNCTGVRLRDTGTTAQCAMLQACIDCSFW